MKKLRPSHLVLIVVLSSITITTVLADTFTITTYPYTITDGSSNQRFVITSSGNVGIGTANPIANLQVNGVPGASPTIYTTSGGQFFYFNPYMCQGCTNPLAQSGDEALIFSNGAQNTGNFVLGSWSNTPAGIRITSSGNVGIGTANPIANLQVNGVPGASPTIYTTSGGQFFYFNPYMCQGCTNPLAQSGDEALIFSNGAQNTGNFVLGSWSNTPAGIRITSSGNVGIGTANPAQKLDVSGNIHLTGNLTSPNNICIGAC